MKCFLVGGAVRDKLLGLPVHERDWVVVGAAPEEMLAAGFKPVGKDFPVFLHPDTNEEYALARTERKSGRGYHGFICYSSPTVTLEEDLARRDLTINAIAEDAGGELIDPYGGRRDLELRLLRHVSPAFAEDPLRILRIARFAARFARLGFRIADETAALMQQMVASGEVDHLVAERIWKETERALQEANPEVYFQVLLGCGALPRLTQDSELWRDRAGRPLASIWTALRRCVEQAYSAQVRFAVLFIGTPIDRVRRCCDHLKVPKAYGELALLTAQHYDQACAPSSAAAAFALLEACDAARRPERFLDFLRACNAWGAITEQCARLEAALAAYRTVSTSPLLAHGLSGQALGAALALARKSAVEESWQ
jgi:tRNA nucleotidyltransferase (CCA-adding enzyme)